MSVAIADAFRYVATSGTNAGEVDGTITAPGVGGTLTIVGGFGITLTADTANRKITITNTGNGTGALTTITAQNSAGTYYPVFTTAPGTFNPATGTYTSSTLYYESTATPLSYNPGTGTLNVQNLVLGAAGTLTFNTTTISGTTGTSGSSMVLSTSPSLTTPTLGVATATSINKIVLTAVATGATITATDGTTITLPSSTGTVPLNNQTFYIGSTSVAINRASASLALTGITSIDGYAAGIAGGAIGYIPYQLVANTTLFVAGNTTTTPQFLTSTGTGSAAQAPTLTGSTGSGSVVLATSPSLTAPTISGHFTAEGVTTTGATGTNKLVFDTSPTLVTPTLGVATATSVNKMAITAPTTSSTLAVADGKTFTVSNTITLAGTDSTTITLPSTTGTVPLNNQTMFIGTTSVAINRATANLALTGISSVAFPGSTSGTATVQATATAGTPTLSLPITTGTLVGTGDTGSVSNAMLANSSVTFGSTAVSLGSTSTSLAGLTSIDGAGTLTSAFATPIGTIAIFGSANSLTIGNSAATLNLANGLGGTVNANLFTASAANSTINFSTGSTATGNTKTINIGTGGLTGSTTAITIGSTTGTSTVTLNGYTPSLAYVTVNLAAVPFTTTNWTSLGSISIPSAGIWRVWANLRIRASGAAEFIKAGLFSSGTSGTGELLNGASAQERMLVERIAQTSGQGFFNLLIAPEWIVNMPTGQTYPFLIFIQVQSSVADAQGLNNNDGNGIPTFNAVKIAPTATSGTTVSIN